MSEANDSKLDSLVRERDVLIVALWNVFRDMSDLQKPDDFTSEDLDLWGLVTSHNAIQSKFSNT